MPTFLLIRHGENDYIKESRLACRLPGVHLNEKGRAQALALAEALKGTPIKAIYSSPLERAIETAEPLARALSLEIIPRPGWIETDCGEWAGRPVKDLRRLKAWKIVQRTPSLLRFQGGESFAEIQIRLYREIEALCALHGPKELIACFSHADPIKLAVAYYIGLPLDQFQRLSIATASITALTVSDSSAQLLALNHAPSHQVWQIP